MKVPIIPATKVAETCDLLFGGASQAVVDEAAELIGEGAELDVDRIDDVSTELRHIHGELLSSARPVDPDQFEGTVGAHLHRTLEDLAIDVTALDSPGFWAFLGTRYFWWFISWRHAATLTSGVYPNYRKYVDGTNAAECVVLRAYLRARLVYEPAADEPYRLTSSVPRGADFWRSHVLRVRTSSSPVLTRSFAIRQTTDRLGTDELRSFAKRLNRTWTNVVLHTYDADDAEALLNDLRE